MTTVRTYYTTPIVSIDYRLYLEKECKNTKTQSKVVFRDTYVNAEGLLAVMIHKESMFKNGGFCPDPKSQTFVPYHNVLMIVALEDK